MWPGRRPSWTKKGPYYYLPKLLSSAEIKVKWTDVDGRAPKEKLGSDKRSSGVHLSGIIQHCLDLSSDRDPDEMPLCMALGLAWEAWAVGMFPNVVWQPGEEELDGVFGTPDGLSAFDIDGQQEVIVEEWKATYKSKATYGSNILSQTIWLWQLAGLCKLTGLRHARLHVFYINGDYRPPRPCYMTYLIEFTKEELDRFWANIVIKNKDKAKPEAHD